MSALISDRTKEGDLSEKSGLRSFKVRGTQMKIGLGCSQKTRGKDPYCDQLLLERHLESPQTGHGEYQNSDVGDSIERATSHIPSVRAKAMAFR